jgi:hypothetical protein
VSEWHDSGILYISGSRGVRFTDIQLAKLRTYVYQGGTIFSHAQCGGGAFTKSMKQIYAVIFPGHELVPLNAGHGLYNSLFRLKGAYPGAAIITNGARPLVIHVTDDVSRNWQLSGGGAGEKDFRFAANLVLYVCGTVTSLSHRGETHWPKEHGRGAGKTVRLAHLEHDGNYDPEPLALERFRIKMADECGIRVRRVVVDIAKLGSSRAGLAFLTGTGVLSLSSGQRRALRDFVTGGGTLLINAAGGGKEFHETAVRTVEGMFGSGAIGDFPATSNILCLPGMEISGTDYTLAAGRRLGGACAPRLRAVCIGGRPAVIISREDITCGLVGFKSGTVDGYSPKSAWQLMRNITLCATGGP